MLYSVILKEYFNTFLYFIYIVDILLFGVLNFWVVFLKLVYNLLGLKLVESVNAISEGVLNKLWTDTNHFISFNTERFHRLLWKRIRFHRTLLCLRRNSKQSFSRTRTYFLYFTIQISLLSWLIFAHTSFVVRAKGFPNNSLYATPELFYS